MPGAKVTVSGALELFDLSFEDRPLKMCARDHAVKLGIEVAPHIGVTPHLLMLRPPMFGRFRWDQRPLVQRMRAAVYVRAAWKSE